MDGGTLAYGLRHTGASILLLERGDFLPQEIENWQPRAILKDQRYESGDLWINARNGSTFKPRAFYFVGGSTKLFGAMLMRMRRKDFEAIEHKEGLSPAWPISYDDLEPYYAQAETIYVCMVCLEKTPLTPLVQPHFRFHLCRMSL